MCGESDAALNRAAALAALLLLAAGESAAQPQPFIERVDVARVVIDVRVVDDDGQPIPGLTPENFEVRIDEEPVRVETALWVGSDEAEGAAVEAVRAADAADSPDPESPGARVGQISQMLDTYYGLSRGPESPGAGVGGEPRPADRLRRAEQHAPAPEPGLWPAASVAGERGAAGCRYAVRSGGRAVVRFPPADLGGLHE